MQKTAVCAYFWYLFEAGPYTYGFGPISQGLGIFQIVLCYHLKLVTCKHV